MKYEAAVCRPAPVEADQEACCRGDVKHTSSCLTSVSIKPCRPVFKPQPLFQRPLLPSPFSQVGLSVELLCEPFPTLPSSKTKKDCDDVSDVDSVPRKTNSWAIKSWKTGSYAGTPTRLQTTFGDVNSEPGVYGIWGDETTHSDVSKLKLLKKCSLNGNLIWKRKLLEEFSKQANVTVAKFGAGAQRWLLLVLTSWRNSLWILNEGPWWVYSNLQSFSMSSCCNTPEYN